VSTLLFPKLPGLTFEIKPTPTWSNIVQKSKNRARTVLMNDPFPLWEFELNFDHITDSPQPLPGSPSNPNGYTDLELLTGFYNARGGSFDSFLLDPGMLTGRPWEWEVRGGPLGTGDGVTTTFYLGRDAGGFIDEVQSPVGPLFISVNGIIQLTGWTQGANGTIVFGTAPAEDAVLTWDGRWMWQVCFSEDTLDVEQFMYELYQLQSLKLEQVKL
jgi:hypothetical protein